MTDHKINFFRDYCLDTNQLCSNYIDAYNATYNRLFSSRTNIRTLVNAWMADYQTASIGIGPEFTLEVERDGGFVNTMDTVERDFMIEAGYRDFILGQLDSNRNINFDASDLNVANQIKVKLNQYMDLMAQ
jgi:hypothetical protein